jgi:hypothetical protein
MLSHLCRITLAQMFWNGFMNLLNSLTNLCPQKASNQSVHMELPLVEHCVLFQDSGHNKPGVLVHCASGYSRSVSVIIGWLMCRKGYLYTEALEVIRLARPRALPNAGFQQQLKMLEACKCDITERFEVVIGPYFGWSLESAHTCWESKLTLTYSILLAACFVTRKACRVQQLQIFYLICGMVLVDEV